MGRGVQTAAVLLAIVAVVCVLVTPDLTDDVDGVFHDCHLDFGLAFAVFHAGCLLSRIAHIAPAEFSTFHHSFNILNLTCTRLC